MAVIVLVEDEANTRLLSVKYSVSSAKCPVLNAIVLVKMRLPLTAAARPSGSSLNDLSMQARN